MRRASCDLREKGAGAGPEDCAWSPSHKKKRLSWTNSHVAVKLSFLLVKSHDDAHLTPANAPIREAVLNTLTELKTVCNVKEILVDQLKRIDFDSSLAVIVLLPLTEAEHRECVEMHAKLPTTLSLNQPIENKTEVKAMTFLQPPFTPRELQIALNSTLQTAHLASQLRIEEQTIEDLCQGALFQGYYRLNSNLDYIYFNSTSLELLRMNGVEDPSSFIGKNIWTAFPSFQNTLMGRKMREAMIERKVQSVPIEFWRPLYGWYETRYVPTLDGGLTVFWSDVTARRNRDVLTEFRANLSNLFSTFQSIRCEEDYLQSISDYAKSLCNWSTFELVPLSLRSVDSTASTKKLLLTQVASAKRDPNSPHQLPQIDTNSPAIEEAMKCNRGVLLSRESAAQIWLGPSAELLDSVVSVAVLPVGTAGQVWGVWILVDYEAGYDSAAFDALTDCSRNLSLLLHNFQLYTAAAKANLAKDRFLAVLSHELRTPLTPVFLLLDAIERDDTLTSSTGTKASLREDCNLIRQSLQLELDLIDDLLDVSRIKSGKISLNRKAVNLHTLITNLRQLLQPLIAEKHLSVTLALDATDSIVCGDGTRLHQVLWNLLRNAIKFTPAGGHICVRTQNSQTESGTIDCIVEDDGIGISSDNLEKLFQAFEQGSERVTQVYGGLGLGLSIAQSLVHLHGGTIQAESEGVGKGAKFTVRLCLLSDVAPVAESPTSGRAIARSTTSIFISPSSPEEPTSKSLKILLVEDNDVSLMVMRRLLQHNCGHTVRTAKNAAEAKAALQSESFDIMLSDIGLPDQNGHALVRDVKAQFPALPCIAVSGYASEQDQQQSIEAGFQEHLSKPISLKNLQRALLRASN